MGRDIPDGKFSLEDFEEFRQRLREESRLLMRQLNEDAFESTEGVCGFELEGWLVDANYEPSPTNEEFLDRVTSPLVFHELSKFNFEINSAPHKLEGAMLSNMERELLQIWRHCHSCAREMVSNILAIGILHTTLFVEAGKLGFPSRPPGVAFFCPLRGLSFFLLYIRIIRYANAF